MTFIMQIASTAICLPVSPESVEEDRRSPKAVSRASGRILVVDDEESVLFVYTHFLERLGYFVTTRAGGLEALATFKENPDQYDLVITDLKMPDMTGDKLAKEISACRSGIPIILVTGCIDSLSEKTAEAAGINATFIKPVLLNELADMIRQLINGDPAPAKPEAFSS